MSTLCFLVPYIASRWLGVFVWVVMFTKLKLMDLLLQRLCLDTNICSRFICPAFWTFIRRVCSNLNFVLYLFCSTLCLLILTVTFYFFLFLYLSLVECYYWVRSQWYDFPGDPFCSSCIQPYTSPRIQVCHSLAILLPRNQWD